jgi:hypothetical protein
MIDHTPNRLVLAVTLLATLALTVSPAFGQRGEGRRGFRGGGGPGGRMTQPEYLRRDLPFIIEDLALDDEQATIAETLLLDYEASFAELAEDARDRMQALRPERPEMTEKQQAERDALRQEMRQIRRELAELREAGGAASEDAMAKIRERMEPLRERMETMRPRIDPAERQAMREGFRDLFKELRTERSALDARFETELRMILSERQIERWPAFERKTRRRKTIPRGSLSGESVDLFIVLREAGIDPDVTHTLQELVGSYATELDHALVARNEYLETGRDAVFDAMAEQDVEKAMRLMEDEKTLRTAVRGVNERYADAIVSHLADVGDTAHVEAFRDGFRRRAYERVYRTTGMQRAFGAAMDLEDVTEEQLVSIMLLQESYLTDLDARNAQLQQVLRNHEPDQITDRARRMAERFSGEGRGRGGFRGGDFGEDDPIRSAFRERLEMDQGYRARLEALLTPEQIAALPAMRRQRDGRRGDARNEQDRERRRAEMIKRFDKDGDGELTGDEREAAREWRRQQRGDRGGRGGRGGRGNGRTDDV